MIVVEESKEIKRYLALFKYAYNAKGTTIDAKKNDEELYYSDVDKNRTQFTSKQLKAIRDKYDIPISTKLIFPMVQQTLSFLTGSQPYPRLITSEEPYKGFAEINERLIHSLWYESNVDDDVTRALEDSLVTGSGYLHVRENSFYEESTMGTIVEHVPWTDVYIDPNSRKSDLSDADFIIVAKPIQIRKAEREWGVTINIDKETDTLDVDPRVDTVDKNDEYFDIAYQVDPGNEERNKRRYVWERVIYEVDTFNQYTSPEGYVTNSLPRQGVAPNSEKIIALQQLRQQKQGVMSQAGQIADMKAQNTTPMGSMQDNADRTDSQDLGMAMSNNNSAQVSQIDSAINEVLRMPDIIHGFYMKLDNGTEVFVQSYVVKQFKRVQRTILIDKQIISQKILPIDVIPVIHFFTLHYRNPYRTYGLVHLIKDVQKAINKLWGIIIYDSQLHNSFRLIAPEGSIQDPQKFEKDFSVPGSLSFYVADPQLPNGGRPETFNVPDTSQTLHQIISLLIQMAEYITGIFGVMQGNNENAPSTFGATQSLQSFGTQRIKLMSRGMNSPFSKLAYVLVKFLHYTIVPEKVVGLLGDLGQDFMENFDETAIDTRFKVRMQITSSLPTTTQMAAQMFSILAGQVPDPQLQQLLIQYAVKFLDLKEADEISSKMDIIQQMQGQLAQSQEEIQGLQSQLKVASTNLAQKDVAAEAEKAKIQIQADKQIQMERNKAEIDSNNAENVVYEPEF